MLFDTIFWHPRSGSVGVQVRVKTCRTNPHVKTCLHAPACQKTKPSFLRDVSCQNVSKRVKNTFFDTPDSFKWLPDASKWLPGPYKSWPTGSKSVKPCQKESKHNANVRKQMLLQSVKTCQNESKNSRVSKRVKTCQKSVKKVLSKCQTCVKTYQNVSKNYRGAVFRVKTCQKNSFLTLFDTFFDTRFCLLGADSITAWKCSHLSRCCAFLEASHNAWTA